MGRGKVLLSMGSVSDQRARGRSRVLPTGDASNTRDARASTSSRPSTSNGLLAGERRPYSGSYVGLFQSVNTIKNIPTPIKSVKLIVSIEYELDGTSFRSYLQGTTAMGSNKDFNISVLKLENGIESSDLYWSLKRLREGGGDRVVEVHVLDGVNLVIERVNCDLEEWLKGEYENFSKGKVKEAEKKKVKTAEEEKEAEEDATAAGWFQFIKEKFIRIFRDLIESLRHIHRHGYVSTGLRDSHSIILEAGVCKAKLTSIKKDVKSEFEYSMRKNIEELREMIVVAILWPYKKGLGVNQADEAEFLKKQNVPYDILVFLKLLTSIEGSVTDIHWLLDDSAFWTNIERYKLVRKLHDKIYVLKKFYPNWRSNDYINNEMEKLNFIFPTSIQDPRIKEILKKAKIDREMHESMAGNGKEKQVEGDGKSNGLFVRILILFRNMEEHYNTPSQDETPVPDKLEKDQIAEMADAMFGTMLGGSVCSFLRHSLGHAWFNWKLPYGFDYMDMLLSEKPF